MITVLGDAPEQKKVGGIIIVANAYRLRYIASFGAYAPPNSKLCLRAVGELAAMLSCGGIFAKGEYILALRLTSELVDLRAGYANSRPPVPEAEKICFFNTIVYI